MLETKNTVAKMKYAFEELWAWSKRESMSLNKRQQRLPKLKHMEKKDGKDRTEYSVFFLSQTYGINRNL